MKRSYYILLILAGWMMILSGCQSPLAGDAGRRSGGQTLSTALSVIPAVDPHRTKSSYTGADDAVNDWNLLVFEGGVLQAKYYQDSGSDLSLSVVTDRPYCYFALANVGDQTGRFTVGTTTIDEMAALRIDADIANGLPMAWQSDGAIAFSRRQLAGGQKLPVQLTRLAGRYDIVVDPSGLTGWTFTATSLSLHGVSSVMPFTVRSRATAASIVADAATAADLAALNAGLSATCYPLENCLGTLLPEGGSPWNKIPANIPSDAYPSYIELGGILRMADGSQLEKAVTCRFCLGENATDNFDVVRNRTHTVTLVLSDAAMSGTSTHWKLETGSFTDTRSLAFTHETIALPAGGSVEEAILRTPSGLRYIVEADDVLVQAGVVVSGLAWGDVCDSDVLTLQAPAGAGYKTGTIRLKTLDGSKTAAATLVVGNKPRILTGLRMEPSEVYLPAFGVESQASGYSQTYYARSTPWQFRLYAIYDDGTEEDVSASADWSGNNFVAWWADNYYHMLNVYAPSYCGGNVSVYRLYYTSSTGGEVWMGPDFVEDEDYLYYFWEANTLFQGSVCLLLSACYTEGGVTKTENAYGTLSNPAKPLRLDIAPETCEAFADGSRVSFSAVCTLDDGTTEDVTSKSVWSADGLVTSEGNGVFTTGYEAGTTKVHATYTARNVTTQAEASLVIRERAVSRIELNVKDGDEWLWDRKEVYLNSNQSWRLRVVYEDQTVAYVYDGFTLASSDPSVVAASGTSSQAVALGTAVVTASFKGCTSNGVILDVVEQNDEGESYDLVIVPATARLGWNETRSFKAFLCRYVNGVEDPGFGTNGLMDVSAAAEWEVSDELLAVASWNAGRQELSANNLSSGAVTGRIRARYDGYFDYCLVTVAAKPAPVDPTVPTLAVSPAELTWEADDSGSSAALTFWISSNVSWSISGKGSHWSVSPESGSGDAAVTVYPQSVNTSETSLETTLTVSGAGVSSQTVSLKHLGKSVQPDVRYKIVTSVDDDSIEVGGTTTASAVLYASTDGGNTYPTVVSTEAASFSNVAPGSHVSISGNTVTGASAGNARIRGHFSGYTADVHTDASMTVSAAPVPETKYLTADPSSLSWDWDASGSGGGKTVSVRSNTSWTVASCSPAFGWSKTATSVTIWPLAANDSFSAAVTGVLVLRGEGVEDVSIGLMQGKRSHQLTGIQFDADSYDLVSIVSGSLCYWQSFAVTAFYDDGSRSDVTNSCSYSDQGSLSVNASTGRLTATAACSGKTVTATYQGKKATATYTAETLECPESLAIGALESQEDPDRNFVIRKVSVTVSTAFASGTTSREQVSEVDCSTSGLIEAHGYVSGSGWQFRFTSAGTGSVTFSYTLNGQTVSSTVNLRCDGNGKVRKL